ncbi:hypothetical protein L4D76_06085 [Photobacterium sagamiensis]|uniref:hypothetical protein n=1 Tax=Photobacterium sagamiensis TaxID=2910241 RepID=UPI003D0AAB43
MISFFLSGLWVAIASQRPLQDNDLILAVQTYHRSRSHGVKLGLGIEAIRKLLNVDDQMFPLMLLKVL